MKPSMLKLDLKAIANSELVGNLSKHLTAYEKKVKELVNDFDLKSRDARAKGQRQLDKLAGQFKKTRTELEKRVTGLLHIEGQRLNQGVSELFNYLKNIAKNEKLDMKPSSSKKKTTKAANGSYTAKKTSTKRKSIKKPGAMAKRSSASSAGHDAVAG